MFTLDDSFEYEEEKTSGKEVIVFFGQKGSGKTSASYMLDGEKVVLSFDGKSMRVKELMRPNDKSIRVYDARKYVSHFKNKLTESSSKNFDYVMFLLNETKNHGGCDWLIIDGLEIVIEMAEMKMRFDHKIGPFDGFATLSFWKDRKVNIRAVHDAALACARKGVIYTTYVDKDEIVNDATLVKKQDVPKWMDIIMYETDAVVRTEIDKDKRFLLKVITSKIKRFNTGDVIDVTGKLSFEGAPVTEEKVEPTDLTKAKKRKEKRMKTTECPKCGAPTATEMGMLCCTKCEWVLNDKDDDN